METKHAHNYRKGTTEVTASTLIHKLAALDQECIRLRNINSDLRAALKAVVSCYDQGQDAHDFKVNVGEFIYFARKAINRAEGKE